LAIDANAVTVMNSNPIHFLLRPGAATVAALTILNAGLPTAPRAYAGDALASPLATVVPPHDGLPRKVLLGTVVSGFDAIFTLPLEKRFQRMDEFVDAMEAQAKAKYPGKRLDLVVLTEWYFSRPGDTLEQQAVRFGDVSERIEACAKRHGCYLIAPLVRREEGEPARYSNVAMLFDREGRVVGEYRKVHPTTDHLGYAQLEGGITPGGDYPVFDCDFGRLGIQICYDVQYPEGWQILAKEGAEIVALPSETSVTARPAMYALQHRYYVVSATPKDHAAVYNPLGMIDEEATKEGVLVHQIDLSYAITGWASGLNGGESLRKKYGDKVGFTYYEGEDAGIFWSNDPTTPIREMFKAFGYQEPDKDAELSRLVQDKVRGGPPTLP
jgi:predicted amidohydrolase